MRLARAATALTVAAVLLAAGCTASPAIGNLHQSPHPVGAPAGPYVGVTWVDDETVVLNLFPDPGQARELAQLDVASAAISPLDLPGLGGCSDADVQADGRLPGGRLNVIRGCRPIDAHPAEFFSYDLSNNAAELLAETEPDVGGASWTPTLDRAAAQVGGLICGSLVWLTASGREDMDVEVSSEEGSFLLSDAADATSDCSDTGRAFAPDVSPDGNVVAFLASPDSIGVAGVARLELPQGLYVFEPGETVARLVLSGLDNTTGPRWSPDGRWIALSGNIGQIGRATVAVEFRTGDVVQITAEVFADLSWSPTGNTLIAISNSSPPGEFMAESLVTIDVSGLATS